MRLFAARWAFLAAFFVFARTVGAEELAPAAPPAEPGVHLEGPVHPLLAGLNAEERQAVLLQLRVDDAADAIKRGDVLAWGKACFPEVFNVPFCDELHGYLVAIRLEEFTSVEAPRGHAKTTISCFLIPIYQGLNEPELFKHYLNIQATDEKALGINRSIKTELEENEVLRRLYGNVRGERWTDGQFVIKVRKGDKEHLVVFTARSTGASFRGILYRMCRPDYIIVDDLYNEDDINNPEATEKKNAWFKAALIFSRSKTKKSCAHLRGTGINLYDQLEANKKNAKASPLTDVKDAKPEGRWICRTFKACDMIAQTVLWPAINSFQSLMADRIDAGSFIFAREMLNERWDEESAIVKRAWLYPADAPSWEFDPAELIFNHKHPLVGVRLGNDPSIGESNQADFNGIALVYMGRQPDSKAPTFYIMDLWNEHLSLDKRVERLEGIKEQQIKAEKPISEARIEAVAGFRDYVAEVKRRVVLAVKTIGKDENRVPDKITNLQNKSKFFENGKVKISKRIDPKLKDELVYQLVTNYPKHDDLRDALLLVLDEKVDWGSFL